MQKRLFLAVNLPNEIKEELADLINKLDKANKNKPIKWVENDNFHLTLHFFGSTPIEKLNSIDAAIKPIVASFPTLNFELSNSINAFPDLNNPKVIFLEMKELDDNKIIALQREIGKALEILEFEIDPRPFRLHLTLGRVKSKINLQIPNFQFPISNFKITSIDLMESELTSNGPIYTILKQYKLKS
ncbi:RNA 2',3'-cyclic phosphodiesterase [Candidatus Falkowbacteria bacterium]|nr:RNA 2',3'-cyclic phosphodiesterase [Candidatus Falkowbacteria bacterium]